MILAIETATRAGSVALAQGKEILGSQRGDASASHSTDLIQTVERTLEAAGVKLSEVDVFAAAVGPGSFTGLRIGLATIKSFAVCTGKTCAAGPSERTVSLLPAGRGELFAQLFSVGDGQVRELDAAAHLSPIALLEKYGAGQQLVWAGEGAHQQVEALRAWADSHNISFNDSGAKQNAWSLAPHTNQLAISVAPLALHAYHCGETVSPNELKAVYVRASDAEINEKWQREK
jgi:tRNA threonylcarbamoyladenosine biosynthesis protein TsaB